MSSKNEVISSLINLSDSIVGIIDKAVSFEESQLAGPDNDKGKDTNFNAGDAQSNIRLMGTDIDHNAGKVDWEKVKSTGTSLVYCKVSGGFSNSSATFQDPGFANYWPQLKQANLARGAYCFFDLLSDGVTQAKLFLHLLDQAGGLEANDLTPCLDIEWTPSPTNAAFPSDDSQWQSEALAWLEYVEKQTGRIPVIYTGLSMAQNHFDSRFNKYPLWVARYPSNDSITPTANPYPSDVPKSLGPWDQWTIWQYSQTGTISGIGPGQDLDVLAGSIEGYVNNTTVGKERIPINDNSQLVQSAPSTTVPVIAPASDPGAKTKSNMDTVGNVSVYQTAPLHAVIYQSGLSIDADGSPFAYHPEPDSDKGLDYLANAGSPGNWWGIATDSGNDSGNPVVQGPNDPAPGFYVSTTALVDSSYNHTDTRAYVNASVIPFIVLPGNHHCFGGGLGDIGAVVNFNNGKIAYVIAADIGPSDKLGEGSIALADALGVNSSPKSGGTNSGIAYCFFPNSGKGDGVIPSLDTINQTGAQRFAEFGGADQLQKLLGGN